MRRQCREGDARFGAAKAADDENRCDDENARRRADGDDDEEVRGPVEEEEASLGFAASLNSGRERERELDDCGLGARGGGGCDRGGVAGLSSAGFEERVERAIQDRGVNRRLRCLFELGGGLASVRVLENVGLGVDLLVGRVRGRVVAFLEPTTRRVADVGPTNSEGARSRVSRECARARKSRGAGECGRGGGGGHYAS